MSYLSKKILATTLQYIFKNDLYNAKYFGLNSNLADNKLVLEELVSIIGVKNVDIIVPEGIYKFGTNYTCPSNVNFIFQSGAIFRVEDSTLTIQGKIISSKDQQIFNLVGTGKITGFKNSIVYPDWWGAKADNSTINNSYINQVINYCKTNIAKTIEFNSGIYLLNGTEILLDRTCKGMKIKGQGNSTIMQLIDDISTCGTIFTISNYLDTNSTHIEDIEITDMKAIGDTTISAATSWFVHTWTNGGTAQIKNLKLKNLDLSYFKTSGMSVEHAFGCEIDTIHTSYNTMHGFSIEDGSFIIKNIWTHHNGLHGIDFAGGVNIIGNGVADNIISEYNGYGMKTAGYWYLTLNNAQIYNNTATAVEKTIAGGRYIFNNIITKNNGGTSLNATSGDGTEIYNINNWISESDNKVEQNNNGSLFFASNIYEVHGKNITVLDSGKYGINIACKRTFLDNVSVIGNNVSYPIKVSGGLQGSKISAVNNNSLTVLYGMQLATKYNVSLTQCNFGDDRANKIQTKGIEIDGATTGRVIIEDCDFYNCSIDSGIVNSTNTGKVEIRGCINAGVYDQKRVQVSATPTTSGTYRKGDLLIHADANSGEPYGWQCTVSGTLGTLNTGNTTGSIKANSSLLIVNSLTGIYVDAYLTIAGVTGSKRIFRMPNALASTTVNVDSASGQKVLKVTVITNCAIGDKIVIGRGTVREEEAIVETVGTGILNLVANLTYTHNASDADKVENTIELHAVSNATVTDAVTSYTVPTLTVVSTLA